MFGSRFESATDVGFEDAKARRDAGASAKIRAASMAFSSVPTSLQKIDAATFIGSKAQLCLQSWSRSSGHIFFAKGLVLIRLEFCFVLLLSSYIAILSKPAQGGARPYALALSEAL